MPKEKNFWDAPSQGLEKTKNSKNILPLYLYSTWQPKPLKPDRALQASLPGFFYRILIFIQMDRLVFTGTQPQCGGGFHRMNAV